MNFSFLVIVSIGEMVAGNQLVMLCHLAHCMYYNYVFFGQLMYYNYVFFGA